MVYLVSNNSSIVSSFPGAKIVYIKKILMFDTRDCF